MTLRTSEYGERHFCFVDTETGGLDPDKNPITQIAALITDLDFTVKGAFHSFVKPRPGLVIDKYAREITGITDELLEGAPDELFMFHAFDAFCLMYPHLRFAGYNTEYDRKMLGAAAARYNLDAPYRVDIPDLDVLAVARDQISRKEIQPFIDPAAPNKVYTLVNVSRFLGVDLTNAHRAPGDIEATRACAWNLLVKPLMQEAA